MERWQQLEEIFDQALQQDAAQRDAYLREACGSDSALRRKIEDLLAHHEPKTAIRAVGRGCGYPVD